MAARSLGPDPRRARVEHEVWNLVVDMAVHGPQVYKPRMRELVKRWRKELFVADYEPTLGKLHEPISGPIEILDTNDSQESLRTLSFHGSRRFSPPSWTRPTNQTRINHQALLIQVNPPMKRMLDWSRIVLSYPIQRSQPPRLISA